MNQYLLLTMGFVSNLHRKITMDAFHAAGIRRSQPWILDYLAEHDGAIQRELADRAHFDPATITSALVRMEEEGKVRRESVPGDKRAQRVYLTELGREKQRYVQTVFAQTDEKALCGFSAEEKQLLGEFLTRIQRNLEKEGEE
ncbi:MAG: MarR family winged helix-turn-helix transcriptional regulator [Candidatus Spyradocola sp.]